MSRLMNTSLRALSTVSFSPSQNCVPAAPLTPATSAVKGIVETSAGWAGFFSDQIDRPLVPLAIMKS